MNVEVQYTAECPNASAILERTRTLVDGRADLTLTIVEVVSGRRVPDGFAGSPTVLLDGANPFGGERVDAPACAVHAPTAEQVERLLEPT